MTSSAEGNGPAAPASITVSHLSIVKRRYGEYARGWTVWGSNPGRGRGFLLFETSISAIRPAQQRIQWVKRPGHEVNHSPTSSAHRNSSLPA
jgi:hypothetical protein